MQNAEKYAIRGFVAEEGITAEFEKYHAEIMGVLERAKAAGERDLGAAILVLAFIALDPDSLKS